MAYIELSQKNLTGVIPPALESIPYLDVLHLSHDALIGMIPLDVLLLQFLLFSEIIIGLTRFKFSNL